MVKKLFFYGKKEKVDTGNEGLGVISKNEIGKKLLVLCVCILFKLNRSVLNLIFVFLPVRCGPSPSPV